MSERDYVLSNTSYTIEEIEQAIEIIYDIIGKKIEHTEKTEPHATKSITEMEKMKFEIFYLLDGLDDEED